MRSCGREGCPNQLGPRQSRYCGRKCLLDDNRGHGRPKLKMPARYCPACSKLLVRRPQERASDFRRRQSCGAMCRARLHELTAAKPKPKPKPVVVVAPRNRPKWRPAGWSTEVPAALLRHRGVAA